MRRPVGPARLVIAVLAAGAVGLVPACAQIQQWQHPAAPPVVVPLPPPPVVSSVVERPLPYPVFESQGFARAVARGTRTRTGEPGPKYWQQFAHYQFQVELVPTSGQVTGRGTVWYYNRSPDTLGVLYAQLNQNLFTPTALRNTPTPVTAGTEIYRVAAAGTTLARSDTGAGYSVHDTRMRIVPPRPVLPGDSIELRFDWSFLMPPEGAPREGSTTGGEASMVAYWYPQMAVYDDVDGWETDPYLGIAGFYMGYADYDVAITVPAGWLVGATGELLNASDVLTPKIRDRLTLARKGGDIVHVVLDEDRGAGKATSKGLDNRLTWRFRALNVPDFSWGTSDKYLWDATIAVVGARNGKARPDTTDIYSLYRPAGRSGAWDQSTRYVRHAVEYLSWSLWPYPYTHLTTVDGPASCGGMAYPMIVCIGGPHDTLSLYADAAQAVSGMWFPVQVGSDQRRYPWMADGLARYNEALGMHIFFTGYDGEKTARDRYLAVAGSEGDVPLMRQGDLYPSGTNGHPESSSDKMATNMASLRALIGDSTFTRAYRAYGQRWVNKHPTPYDFWNGFNYFSGRDLSWFWRTWWFENWTLDQSIASVVQDSLHLTVSIQDRGLAMMPVRLAITRARGVVERRDIPVDVWLGGSRHTTVTVDDPASVISIEIDPEHAFPDVDRRNNRWVKP